MKDHQSKPMAGASQLIIVANDKGGQGKTLLALGIADHAYLHDAPLAIAQVDTQRRLARAVGRNVLTIAAVPRETRRDPSADARSFTPLYSMLERVGARNSNFLLDIGANQVERFVNWAGLADLDEDLEEWGYSTTLIVPLVAESEGIRHAGLTAGLLLERFPRANLVLVQNQRDGAFRDLHPSSDAAATYRACIEPLMGRAALLRMPVIEAGAWRAFEAANCRLMQVPTMELKRIMALTGLPRPESKISRGDVAAWTASMFAEFDRVLPWPPSETE
jgi:hypothetical protein